MIEESLTQQPRGRWRILEFLLGLTPGMFLAIHSYVRLQEPDLEIAALIPVFTMTIGGLAMFLVGGALFIVSYIRGHRSYFSVGFGLSGLILLATYFFYIFNWL